MTEKKVIALLIVATLIMVGVLVGIAFHQYKKGERISNNTSNRKPDPQRYHADRIYLE